MDPKRATPLGAGAGLLIGRRSLLRNAMAAAGGAGLTYAAPIVGIAQAGGGLSPVPGGQTFYSLDVVSAHGNVVANDLTGLSAPTEALLLSSLTAAWIALGLSDGSGAISALTTFQSDVALNAPEIDASLPGWVPNPDVATLSDFLVLGPADLVSLSPLGIASFGFSLSSDEIDCLQAAIGDFFACAAVGTLAEFLSCGTVSLPFLLPFLGGPPAFVARFGSCLAKAGIVVAGACVTTFLLDVKDCF